MKLLFDVSNIIYALYSMKHKEFDDIKDLQVFCKETFIKSVYYKISEHGAKQSDVILATDNSSWRKDIFKFYKFKRSEQKKKSEIDYEIMNEFYDSFMQDISELFPFHVLNIEKCEADDIIGVLTNYFHNKIEEVYIISRDKDFLQLIDKDIHLVDPFRNDYIVEGKIYKNVMSVTTKEEALKYKLLHIITGDTTDGIMNMLSDDHVLAFPKVINGKKEKQTSIGWKKISKLLNEDGTLNMEEYKTFIKQNTKNWLRNKKLIDLNDIPNEYKDLIINTYKESVDNQVEFNFNKLAKYFHKNGLKELHSLLMSKKLIKENTQNRIFD